MRSIQKIFETYHKQRQGPVPALGDDATPSEEERAADEQQNRHLFDQITEKELKWMKHMLIFFRVFAIGIGVTSILFPIFSDNLSTQIEVFFGSSIVALLVIAQGIYYIGREMNKVEFAREFAKQLSPERLEAMLENWLLK